MNASVMNRVLPVAAEITSLGIQIGMVSASVVVIMSRVLAAITRLRRLQERRE